MRSLAALLLLAAAPALAKDAYKVEVFEVNVSGPEAKYKIDRAAFMKDVADIYKPAGITFDVVGGMGVTLAEVIPDATVRAEAVASHWTALHKEPAEKDIAAWEQALVAYSLHVATGRDVVKIFYMPGHPYADVRGVTIRADKYPALRGHGPIVVINTGFVAPATLAAQFRHRPGQTLAHELGHALLNDGTHPSAFYKPTGGAKNLMVEGSQRTAHDLNADQITKLHAGAYTKKI